MENKYYIPDITEFRIGFEYEIEMGGNWYSSPIKIYLFAASIPIIARGKVTWDASSNNTTSNSTFVRRGGVGDIILCAYSGRS